MKQILKKGISSVNDKTFEIGLMLLGAGFFILWSLHGFPEIVLPIVCIFFGGKFTINGIKKKMN